MSLSRPMRTGLDVLCAWIMRGAANGAATIAPTAARRVIFSMRYPFPLSLRGAARRSNLRQGARAHGDCFASLAMTGIARAPRGDMSAKRCVQFIQRRGSWAERRLVQVVERRGH